MFKLTPAAYDFSICLRCLYRLGLRQGPRSGHRRPTKHPQQLRRFTSGPSLRQGQLSSHDATTNNDNLERVPIRYITEEPPPDANYRQRNEPSTKDSLGLNALGEPAQVLILRDKRNNFRPDLNMARVRASGPDKNPAQEPISSSGMLKEMDVERGIVDIDEVCKNIESVGASWAARTKGSITGVAYKDLVSRLQEGFTKRQLGAYLHRAGKNPAADVFNLNVESSNSLYARSSWQLVGNSPLQMSKAPEISSNPPEGESKKKKGVSRREYVRGIKKDVLVKRLLRQCWNITPRFKESSLGQMDIRLTKLHLNLILNHKRDILKLISRSYDSKVEAWPQDRIIRITSDYDNCVDIFKLLIHTLENIQVSTIDLAVDSMSHEASTPFPRELSEVVLRQIEGYTNTLVRAEAFPHKTLRVYYIGPDDADLLETRRLIHQILQPASTQNLELAWSKGDGLSNAIPVPVLVGSRLSLLDRNQQWSRWCSPHIQIPIRKREKDGAPPSNLSAGLATQGIHGKWAFKAVKTFFEAPNDTSYKLCNNITPYWTPEIEYHDSVKLGQVLYPANKAGIIADALERNRARAKKRGHKIRPIYTKDIGSKSLRLPRKFLPLVPGLIRSLESLGPLEKSEKFWQVRLSPSSKNLSLRVPAEALPDLEIRVFFDDKNKTFSIKDIRLVNGKDMDFLQPEHIVDLRFARKQCVYAREDSIDPRIASFVHDSNFDSTEHLKTPPGLSLSIPAFAIQPHNGFDPKNYETLLVDYTSLGLEHTSSLTMPYQEPDSWPTLTYTSVEAGRIGGRRDELSLHNFRFASQTRHPDSSPVSNIDSDSLSDDDHTSILFHKTAALIDTIEHGGTDKTDKQGLSMPEVRRWRRIARKKVRMIEVPKARNRPGYVPPVNGTVRRVFADWIDQGDWVEERAGNALERE